ncbi:PAS domain S-box protein [Parablastomonas sp. CN1-191]|uniref:PAS domain S-box protein n=1 Tax=Parablastomonas sp. CN1-191 TaxID=3400908 RepID=UPI003BF8BEA0
MAILTSLMAALFSLGIADPLFGDRSVLLIYVLPVAFSLIFGGRGPGILAGGLALGFAFWQLPADHRFYVTSFFHAALFIGVCGGVGWLVETRGRAHALAARSRGQLELLVDGVSDYAMVLLDRHGRIASWNTGAERLFGRSRADVVGRSAAILLANAEAETIRDQLTTASAEGRFLGEVWHKRADGSEFLAEVSVRPVTSPDGASAGYAKIVHDVTTRRAEERALRRREAHLQSILATVPDAMVVIDDHGIILSFSRTAQVLFGMSEAAAVGCNVSILMPSPDREAHDGYIQRYLDTAESRIIGAGRVVTGARADGTTFPMHLSIGEVDLPGQRLFTGFIQDLTERRGFEDKVEELQAELIHVARLSALGMLASTLAHELNQPLTAIANYAEAVTAMLGKPVAGDSGLVAEAIGEISAQSLRAGRIVRRLRDFVAHGELSKAVEDLPAVIAEASSLALVGTSESVVRTIYRFDPDATPVLIDRIQIQQVLFNLMRNAVEAMADSPLRELTVETALIAPDTVEVAVTDTGCGIDPLVQARLFDAFNTTKASGLGLGLSICRTIVEAHGGSIAAEPGDRGGTRFSLTLVKPPPSETEATFSREHYG